jgi:hypothetical protein
MMPTDDNDPINHPAHYTKGGVEVIDFIDAWDLDFYSAQIIKYVIRAPHKNNQLDDLKKARWYLQRLIENTEKTIAGRTLRCDIWGGTPNQRCVHLTGHNGQCSWEVTR